MEGRQSLDTKKKTPNYARETSSFQGKKVGDPSRSGKIVGVAPTSAEVQIDTATTRSSDEKAKNGAGSQSDSHSAVAKNPQVDLTGTGVTRKARANYKTVESVSTCQPKYSLYKPGHKNTSDVPYYLKGKKSMNSKKSVLIPSKYNLFNEIYKCVSGKQIYYTADHQATDLSDPIRKTSKQNIVQMNKSTEFNFKKIEADFNEQLEALDQGIVLSEGWGGVLDVMSTLRETREEDLECVKDTKDEDIPQDWKSMIDAFFDLSVSRRVSPSHSEKHEEKEK